LTETAKPVMDAALPGFPPKKLGPVPPTTASVELRNTPPVVASVEASKLHAASDSGACAAASARPAAPSSSRAICGEIRG
jgi:hypothetical protein